MKRRKLADVTFVCHCCTKNVVGSHAGAFARLPPWLQVFAWVGAIGREFTFYEREGGFLKRHADALAGV